MNNLSLPIKLDGYLIVDVLDAKSGEIEDQHVYKNTVSRELFDRTLLFRALTYLSMDHNPRDGTNLWLTETANKPHRVSRYIRGTTVQGALHPLFSPNPQWFNGNPDYIEWRGRFNPGASTRNIRTFYLGNSFSGTASWALAVIEANPPCVQLNTQVLDVTYRLQLFYQTPSNTGLPVAPDYGKVLGQLLLENSYFVPSRIRDAGAPYDTRVYIANGIPEQGKYNSLVTFSENLTSRSVDYNHRKWIYTMTRSTSSDVGRIFGIASYGKSGTTDCFNIAWAPITPSNFPNKPVQPIHNHSAAATSPYLDVSFLATGDGSLNVNGSNWVPSNGWPEFYRIDILNDGDIGTSRYIVRKRTIAGLDNSYRPYTTSFLAFKMQKWWQGGRGVIGGYGIESQDFIEEYDLTTVVTWSGSGISIQNQMTGAIVHFSTTTTPALPATGIQQVAVSEVTRDVYVAASSGGLLKISDVWGTPTITHFTNAMHGVPHDTNAYGVSVTYNDSIMALFNGGLAHSTDGGNSWTVYNPSSTPAFNYSGITDANWSLVKGIRCDRQSSRLQTLLIRDTTTAWWSLDQPGVVGPTYTGDSVGEIGRLRVSRYSTFWALAHVISSIDTHNCRVYRLTFGSSGTTVIPAPSNNDSKHLRPIFLYDRYLEPYVLSYHSSSSGSSVPYRHGLCNKALSSTGLDAAEYPSVVFSSSSIRHVNPCLAFEENGGFGYCINRHYHGTNDPYNILTVSPYSLSGSTLALNGTNTPFEELVWEQYGWNGSAWVKNYNAPAIDTAPAPANQTNGIRFNFKPESHTFTGRACINASSVFTPGLYGSPVNMTFACTIIPQNKATAQESEQALLSFSGDGTTFCLVLWRDGSGNIRVNNNNTSTTIAATPAMNTQYRVVLVFNSTGPSVTVYSNGINLGSTTINSFDLSSNTTPVKFFIGISNALPAHVPTYFFRGSMTNVQFWNVAWSATDVANDYLDVNGILSPNPHPAGSLTTRYELTQPLIEGKPTHTNTEDLINGLTIDFSGPSDGPAPNYDFTGTDYYTFGVVDGILKDNAISFSQKFSLYFSPVDNEFNQFTNRHGGNTISNLTANVVDEPVYAGYNSNGTYMPGAYSLTAVNGYIVGSQHLSSDGNTTFSTFVNNITTWCGLSNANSSSTSTLNYAIRFNNNSTISVVESGTVRVTNAGTYNNNSVLRVKRVGTQITYHYVVNNVEEPAFYTSTVSSSGNIWPHMASPDLSGGVYNWKVSYVRQPYIMDIGNELSLTGKFNPKFVWVDTETPQTVKIYLDGVPANIIANSTPPRDVATPAPGQITYNGAAGILLCNSADVGKAVTGTVTVIYDM